MGRRLLAGRYELIEKIGEGGMAVVYKARCRLLNRYVAIKILRPEFTKDETFVDNFKKESQAAAGLTHPNIVSVFDVGKEGNINFIVMELVEGKPLSQIIAEKGKMDYKEVIDISRQIASALSLAHKNQIIHRDVKPHNVLINSNGVAKLADFGIARAVDQSNVTESNKVMGSVHYLSPEQARGSYVDERTDIYSLGIVMYEMLTGKVPFDGENAISIALMHINNPMTPPSQLTAGIPPQLERVIMKATDKYQTNRYSKVDEVIEELDNIDFITKVMGKKAFLASDADLAHLDFDNKSTPDYPERRDTILRRDRFYNQEAAAVDSSEKERERAHEREREHNRERERERERERSRSKNNGLGKLAAAIVIAALILGGAGIFALGTMLGWFGPDNTDVAVPYLVGKTMEQAAAELEAMGLIIKEGQQVDSPDQEKGNITSHTPSEGTVVAQGTAVTVNISRGKKDGVVPTIINKNVEQAEAYLAEYNFKLGTQTMVESHLPKGTIISQSPEAGEKAKNGASVNVEVSDGKGKEMTKVPNMYGLTKEQADAALAAAGLTVDADNVKFEENELAPPNTVLYQTISTDTEVEVGTKIGYTLAKAPEVILPPELADPAPEGEDAGDGGEGTGNETPDADAQPNENTGTEG
ncbi:MAG: Stk1 family PASTA domain-containing Ser/Thr kinase [Firmicutes bacterium]|nr:Stk1 family PASTA domain-containing Ser/Thr kinase [Bacillota bacterium]